MSKFKIWAGVIRDRDWSGTVGHTFWNLHVATVRKYFPPPPRARRRDRHRAHTRRLSRSSPRSSRRGSLRAAGRTQGARGSVPGVERIPCMGIEIRCADGDQASGADGGIGQLLDDAGCQSWGGAPARGGAAVEATRQTAVRHTKGMRPVAPQHAAEEATACGIRLWWTRG
jgi:hypothetical protein